MEKKEALFYVHQTSVVLIALFLLTFPLFFLTNTTDVFIFPKQILVAFATILLLILLSARIVLEKRITIVTSPLNVPIVLFSSLVLLSSIFSRNLYDSLFQSIPMIFALLFYFVFVNTITEQYSFKVALSSFLLGATLASSLSILQAVGLTLFPYPLAQSKTFNTLGSSVQLILYLVPVIFLVTSQILVLLQKPSLSHLKQFGYQLVLFSLSGIIAISGIGVSLFSIVKAEQKPILLPFAHGLQIAFAAISQDTQRLLFSLVLGTGYGTFLSTFTRFKTAAFNLEKDIWSFPFSYSSSYVLELLPTIGLLGTLLFLFWALRTFKMGSKRKNAFQISLVVLFLLSFLVPFSYSIVFLLFLLTAFFTSSVFLEKSHSHVYAISLSLVALKHGFIQFEPAQEKVESPVFSTLIAVLLLLFCGFVGFYAVKLFTSDITFRQSLEQSSLVSGNKTYTLQRDAIQNFPYRSDYHRVFSQVNLALANSLAQSSKESSPSAETQRTIIALIQQSINTARIATSLSPGSTASWYNLSQIYRNLINVGQNADQFALVTLQQALQLDPYNPALYIDLGGIYYQLTNFELAQQQFQIAANLKRDYANAYYNLGHALEAKGNLQEALVQYQTVKNLVRNNKQNYEKIVAEIDALEARIGKTAQKIEEKPEEALAPEQPPLQLSTPSAKLPPQKSKVELPAPPKEATKSAQ